MQFNIVKLVNNNENDNIINDNDNNEKILYDINYKKNIDNLNYIYLKDKNKTYNNYKQKEELCNKYNFNVLSSDENQPRIFWGTIFNSEIDLLYISLYEMSDLLHSFTIIESNVTFTGVHRELLFPKLINKLINKTTLFNNKIIDKIIYQPWYNNDDKIYNSTFDTPSPGSPNYGREQEIRNKIGETWKKLGMKSSDIGILGDSDEFISREFLYVLKTCDIFSEFNKPSKYNINTKLYEEELLYKCSYSKIQCKVHVYSSYFDCPQQNKNAVNPHLYPGIKWCWHPDVIPGIIIVLNKY
jgi:hypothetical protein